LQAKNKNSVEPMHYIKITVMKKNLLSFLFFSASIFSIQAQTLYATTYNGGKDDGGTLIKFEPAANSLTVLKSFETHAAKPYYTSLIQASDGKLYGMTAQGGDSRPQGANDDYGVIFSFDPSTSNYTMLKKFDGTNGKYPRGSLIQASNGKLYGMTQYGGSNNGGVIFSFDPFTSTFTKLKDFDDPNDAPFGNLIQASDGKLYGMTLGFIFSFDPSTSIYTKLKDLDGFTNGSLVQASDGKLYGMTNSGTNNTYGGIFSFDPSNSTYTKLKDFDGSDGAFPFGSLIQGSDGKLYGMTSGGGVSGSGVNGYGVIFSLDPFTSTYTKLKDFDGTDGRSPYGSLVQANDGKLYAMTYRGGNTDDGVVFSFDPGTSIYKKLKDFDYRNIADGISPYGSLMQASNGKLYGMTTYGGSSYSTSWYRGDNGVIFSFDLPAATYTKVMDLDGSNGGSPCGALIRANDGKLYGMTQYGGSSGLGAIFSYDLSTATYKKLVDFDGVNGAKPFGSLMQASDGKLYGMTSEGGNQPYYNSPGLGVIFSYDLSTSTYTKILDFGVGAALDCVRPLGSLIQANDGKLYGMAEGGYGVIFSLDPSTSTFTRVYDFDGSKGRIMYASSLMQASDGKLYGMTSGDLGGIGSVIFSFDLSTSTYTKLNDTGGMGNLVQASNGKLYGMTYYNIFSIDPSTSAYTNLRTFDFSNEGDPYGNLVQASDGKLYGMTYGGGMLYGNYVHGVIFSFDPYSSTYTKLKDFDGTNGAFPFWGSGFVEAEAGGCGTVIPVLSISATPGTDSACVGQPVTFIATPTNGGSTPTYQWKVDGNNVGDDRSSYSTTALTNGQVVSCIMTTSLTCASSPTVTSNPITMTVNTAVTPTIVISQTICGRDSVSFSSTITNGGNAPAYLWTYTGSGNGSNSTGSEFSIYSPSNGIQVQCSLVSNAPCASPVQVISSPLIINCVTTGVSNIDELEEFKIMPNPSNGSFIVKINLNTQREVRFILFNSMGQPVFQSPLTRMNGIQTKQINVPSLPGAAYFLKTEIGKQAIYKTIIIKKN